MGIDIEAWIEVRRSSYWHSVVDAGYILGRSYDMYGCLFGVRNHANFAPVVQERGLPSDLSEQVEQVLLEFIKDEDDEDDDGPFGLTWASLDDFENIDYDEKSLEPDSRVHRYEVHDDGSETYLGKAASDTRVAPFLDRLARGEEIRNDNEIYRREYLTRGDALNHTRFPLVLSLMRKLGETYGKDNVRLVAFFAA